MNLLNRARWIQLRMAGARTHTHTHTHTHTTYTLPDSKTISSSVLAPTVSPVSSYCSFLLLRYQITFFSQLQLLIFVLPAVGSFNTSLLKCDILFLLLALSHRLSHSLHLALFNSRKKSQSAEQRTSVLNFGIEMSRLSKRLADFLVGNTSPEQKGVLAFSSSASQVWRSHSHSICSLCSFTFLSLLHQQPSQLHFYQLKTPISHFYDPIFVPLFNLELKCMQIIKNTGKWALFLLLNKCEMKNQTFHWH